MNKRTLDALTKWLPLSAVASGLSLAIGSILNLPQMSTVTAATVAGVTVFTGFAMRSYGRGGKEYDKDAAEYHDAFSSSY
ncbi:MAG: hypothetical protein ABI347_08105 [Nitrososphaera sp.]|jgi:hypothetical protein